MLWLVLGFCILIGTFVGWYWWTSQGRYRVKQIPFEPVAWRQADPRHHECYLCPEPAALVPLICDWPFLRPVTSKARTCH